MSKRLKELIKNETVVFLKTSQMEDTIKEMLKTANEQGYLKDEEKFRKAIFERESLVSTGIGLGVAIPHAKLEDLEDFFIIVGINKEGLDWDAIDRKPVGIVFLIGGPDKSGSKKEYLQIISKIMLLIKNDNRREALFNAEKKEDVVKLFEKF
jgi:PTS system nitrogen regulatory IIA component